ncbi:MAG TPA: hypothetical protein VLG46_13230 [Anaerolineae bacterium]|nr:hypothetical protein [Anaerolineae bacterium]
MLNTVHNSVTHKYVIRGYGNSINVQARLAQRGHVYHAEWDPGPPSWRLTYDTALSEREVTELVKDMTARYDLKITRSD